MASSAAGARITLRIVEHLRPGEIVWDTAVRGFGVRCQRKHKIYVLKATIAGRQRWFSIGEHGAPWTPETARQQAQVMWGKIRSGEDLVGIRNARRDRATISDLCARYLQEHAREHKKASSAHMDERNIENHIRPLLGEAYADEITRADIDRFKRAVREGKTRRGNQTLRGGAVVRGGAIVANRCLALLSKMLNLAEVWGVRPENSNPVRHIEKYKEGRRERYLTAEEFAHLGDALAAAAVGCKESPFAIAAIRLLVLTGARLGEILTLQWRHVLLEEGTLKLPDSKTGRKTVWLNPPAIEVLSTLPRVAGNDFVIVGDRAGSHLVNIHKMWKRICHHAGLADFRIHDLRHSYASVAVGAGVGLYLTGKILGHLRHSTTERYAHLADAPVREANTLIGNRINGALGPRLETAAAIQSVDAPRPSLPNEVDYGPDATVTSRR
jgi:integrase